MAPDPKRQIRCAATLVSDPDADRAAAETADRLSERLEGFGADLLTVFISAHHAESAEPIAAALRSKLGPRALIGVTGESVLAGATEAEGRPAIAAWALAGAALDLRPFTEDELPPNPADDPDAAAAAFGMDAHARATLLFADPFSTPVLSLLPAMEAAAGAAGVPDAAPIFGGVASGGSKAGEHRLLIDGRVRDRGLVGVTLAATPNADVRIDSVVSQGCRPIGPDLVITKARGNAIQQLGGRPALAMVKETLEALGDDDRALLERGLFLGRVVNEYKDRFGRGDYLIRAIVGAEPTSGAIAVNDLVRVGQTVRLHLRDADTAHEDLALLLDGQKLHGPPAGGLLFTCNGRGAKLFGEPHHDAAAVVRAFAPPEAGERLAKAGKPYAETPTTDPERAVPLAGFFAGGEIGPIGGRPFLHGHTASLMLFRDA